MSDVNPLVNFSRLDMFGLPHHGLCRDGILTKADGSTMAYPQPIGMCRLLKDPGTPPVTRTASEAASDAANHHEWLDYLLLTHDLNGLLMTAGAVLFDPGISHNPTWIFKDDSGAVWGCQHDVGLTVSGGTGIATFYFRRLGLFSYPDNNTPSGDGSVSFTFAAPDFPTVAGLYVLDVASDGRKYAVMCEYETTYQIVEVEISGSIDPQTGSSAGLNVTATVVKTPAQCFDYDTLPYTPTAGVPVYQVSMDYDEGGQADWPAWEEGATSFDFTKTASVQLTQTGTLNPYEAYDATYAEAHEYVEMLFHAFYDSSDTLKFLSFRAEYDYECENSVTTSTGGTWKAKETSLAWDEDLSWDEGSLSPRQGAPSITSDGDSTVTKSGTITETFSYKMSLDGAVVYTQECRSDHARWFKWTNSVDEGSYNTAGSVLDTFSPDLAGTVFDSAVTEDTYTDFDGVVHTRDYATDLAVGRYSYAISEVGNDLIDPLDHAKTTLRASESNTPDFVLHTNTAGQLYQLMMAPLYTTLQDTDPVKFGPLLTANGVEGGEVSVTYAERWSTRHPVTGEVISNQADKVCFV